MADERVTDEQVTTSTVVNDLVDEFEGLRSTRIERAKQFVLESDSVENLLVDVSNVVMLVYVGLKYNQVKPKDGFQSTMER